MSLSNVYSIYYSFEKIATGFIDSLGFHKNNFCLVYYHLFSHASVCFFVVVVADGFSDI